MCNFDEAWIGKCKAPGAPFCEKHAQAKCASCGAQATHSCDATGGPLVCGSMLCDACEHTNSPVGTCSPGLMTSPPAGMQAHCRRDQQKYSGWLLAERTPETQGCVTVFLHWREFIRACNTTGLADSAEEPFAKLAGRKMYGFMPRNGLDYPPYFASGNDHAFLSQLLDRAWREQRKVYVFVMGVAVQDVEQHPKVVEALAGAK